MTSRESTPVVRARGLSKFYGQVLGLNDVTLTVGRGITGVLGPNGAGKSTFLWLLAGQLLPSQGSLELYGCALPGGPEVRRQVGLCPEPDAFYWEMTGRQFVAGLARLSGITGRRARSRAQEVLEQVGLAGVMDRAIRTYSRGMRQRTKLAQALVADPQLLLLDEPLAGADPVGRHELIELIRDFGRRGKDVLVSSHVLQEVEALTDVVVLLYRGRVVAEGRIETIRELLDQHPHQVVIECDRVRELARTLIQSEDVVSCQVSGADTLTVRTRRPQDFYRQLPKLLMDGSYRVRRIQTADDSLEAVFRYLATG